MTPEQVAIIMLAAFLILILTGFPLAFVLGGLAIIFGVTLWGSLDVVRMFSRTTSTLMTSIVYVCTPLFIFMGAVLQRSGAAEAVFDALYIVLGRLKAGLAISTVVICTFFAAATGIIGASITVMGLLALPAMLKHQYNRNLTTGTIMAAGCLGTIIPPSIILIIYGAEAQVSIAGLFIGGIGPGLVLSGLYIAYIVIRSILNPEMAPPISREEASKYTARQKLRMTAISVVPTLFLIFAVLGTIFLGVATPTEAAGLGSFGAILLSIAYRRFNWGMLRDSCYQCMKITAMVMWIILCAKMFTSIFLGLGGGEVISNLVLGLELGRWQTLGFILFIILIMGMFIDCYGILLIGIPLFCPIVNSLGFDPLWFGLMFAIMIQASYLTPPFAYAVFYLQGVSPPEAGINTGELYKAVLPFIVLQLIGLVICARFPEIMTWLPSLMWK
ncbi:C4-dicarboxylate TRAP transporter large permease protein DctM [subsurface metagenome]